LCFDSFQFIPYSQYMLKLQKKGFYKISEYKIFDLFKYIDMNIKQSS
jgi:hypothetical protein